MKQRHNIKIIGFSIVLFSILFTTTVNAQTKTKEEKVYIKIEIKGMACPFCDYGMEKKLKKVTGDENVEIELEEGLAYISTPIAQRPTTEVLKQIITDAGFTIGEIKYSDSPFKTAKD